MKRMTSWTIAALGLLAGGAALAISPGDTVYIRARDTRAYPKEAKGKVSGTPATLQPSSAAYKWQKNVGTWNQVQGPNGKSVWVYGPNLSLTPPQQELIASKDGGGGRTDMSAADAIKGLGAGAQWYAGELSAEKGAVAKRSVATAEAISYQAGLKTGGEK